MLEKLRRAIALYIERGKVPEKISKELDEITEKMLEKNSDVLKKSVYKIQE